MKTLIFANSISNYSSPLIKSPPKLLFHFSSLYRENRKFNSKWIRNPKAIHFSPIKASSSPDLPSYGGWDELRLVGDSVKSGESIPLRHFLVSIGIDDKKHVFMFLLGLVCALAICRVRVSPIIVFPATVLVFAVGFSFGFIRGGSFGEVNAIKRRSKEGLLKGYSEMLRSLLDFFEGFQGKVGTLKNDIKGAIDCNKITINDLENYLKVVESINVSASNARDVVEACIVNVGNSNSVSVESHKPERKRKEIDGAGVDWFQFIGGLFGEKVVNSKPNKVKDNIKQGTVESVANDQNQENNLCPGDEEIFRDPAGDNKGMANSNHFQNASNKSKIDRDWDRRKKRDMLDEKMRLGEMSAGSKGFIESEEYSYHNKRLQFTNNRRDYLNMDDTEGSDVWNSHDNLLDSVDFRVSWKHMESEASFIQEQMLKKSSGVHRPSENREKNENLTNHSLFGEKSTNSNVDSYLLDRMSAHGSETDSSPSSVFTNDILFDRYLTEANDLLKQAKECIRGNWDDEHAEMILYKSAELLSRAVAMKPMSLLAVGQLGNTYLLHGELKLRISRELRNLLSRNEVLPVENRKRVLKGVDYQLVNKDRIASLLVDVCEECEELLVKAGRKYRLALSIDGNDVRALYNWGLALFFRAQLIADIGPEAASDADKIFLAAIDKFDAMMSKGNVYAPDALFRWAVVLQQRSRLRPGNSKEKVKLLQQAKRLYEDALYMDSDNRQAREALLSCMSELDYRDF